jgi:hypothetical protein
MSRLFTETRVRRASSSACPQKNQDFGGVLVQLSIPRAHIAALVQAGAA